MHHKAPPKKNHKWFKLNLQPLPEKGRSQKIDPQNLNPAAQTLAGAKQNASQSSPKGIHKWLKINSEPLPEKGLSQELDPKTTHVHMLKP